MCTTLRELLACYWMLQFGSNDVRQFNKLTAMEKYGDNRDDNNYVRFYHMLISNA